MLIILLIISISLIIVGCVVYFRCNSCYEYLAGGLITTGAILGIAMFIFALVAITYSIKVPQMEERITIYKEENTRIEEQIKIIIEAYQDYEQGVFEDIDLNKISSEKLILLTSIYPELKSDAMVQELIQVHINNTNEIKELRTTKLDYEVWRWWLCFR